nr:retrovirus-related Pol polyprotein from transposon TNT 1-94 [Tanacetum cinerariifolium]
MYCALNNVENKTKRKRSKRKSSKQNDKQMNNNLLRANRDFVQFLDLDNYSSVRRPKRSSVILQKKESSNASCVDLSSFHNSKLNKDVKRYSRKNLLSCNNSHHVDSKSAYACNVAMNVSCKSRLHASYDLNDLCVFDDVSIRNPRVIKMPFRKKPRNCLNVRTKNNSNNFLPRTLFRWFPKMQSLAEPVVKWIPKVKRQIDRFSKTHNSIGPIFKWHMTGNRSILTNFVENFLGKVRFENEDFTVIAGYGDVVIGSMRIKKVYYVEGFLSKKYPNHVYALDKALYGLKQAPRKLNMLLFLADVLNIKPANIAEALKDADWASAMQEKLDQFARLKVWRLVTRPKGKTITITKLIFKNKKEKSSLIIQNKARLVAQGYHQEEGIDYDETFAPIA